MLQLLAFTHENIIATKTNHFLGMNDYAKINPLIHNIISSGKKVRWYFEMEDCCNSSSTIFWKDGGSEFKYGKLNFAHSGDIEKIAIVGAKKWENWMVSIMRPFTNAIIMYFELTDRERGMEWIANQE